jgi:hypothetical protein
MLSPVSALDWSVADHWWESFEKTERPLLASRSIRDLPAASHDQEWQTVDAQWDAFRADHELLFTEVRVQRLSDSPETAAWGTVDEFWDGYVADQADALARLQEAMHDLREWWAAGDCQFDDDPLTTNWRAESQYEGPLRGSIVEEDWSQWLAHLLRQSSGPFAHELLDTPNQPPESVRREVVFAGANSQRRVDILVEYADQGVSIEVKQGDEHYGKTPETAGLVEANDHRDWDHVLLLQKAKLPRLERTFGDALARGEEGLPTVRSSESADIDVRYWQHVSRLLRRILVEGREENSHWVASAYLFITLIEQRILALRSFSFVNPEEAEDHSGAPRADVHQLVMADPEKQINYLRSLVPENDTHE